MEYLSPQGVLLPRVYATTAPPLLLELRGPAAWQATSSGAVCKHTCHQLLPCSGRRLPWSPMQPGRARTSGLAVPLLPLARCVGWVAPVRLTLGCRSLRPVTFLASVHVRVRCPRPLGASSPVRALCAVCVCCCCLLPHSCPPNFLFFSFFLHCRHRHGQLVQRCCSVVFCGVCRRCFVGCRAPGLWLARLDVHGYWSGWVWLVASLFYVLDG